MGEINIKLDRRGQYRIMEKLEKLNRIKLIKRSGYGFRNLENFKIKKAGSISSRFIIDKV